MSTPGGYDPNAGNPYGGSTPPPPGGYNPYGGATPPPPPGGSHPYGGLQPGGQAPLDGVSIASLVTALLCCTGPIGVILGIIGIVRTKNGQRRGRWMSVVGIVVGILATLTVIGAFVSLFWVGTNAVPESDARVGQCVNTRTIGVDSTLWKADCNEPHDAEIIATGTFDDRLLTDRRGTSVEDFCQKQAAARYDAPIADSSYRIDWATDAVGNEVATGDSFACYLERADGEKLTEPLA